MSNTSSNTINFFLVIFRSKAETGIWRHSITILSCVVHTLFNLFLFCYKVATATRHNSFVCVCVCASMWRTISFIFIHKLTITYFVVRWAGARLHKFAEIQKDLFRNDLPSLAGSASIKITHHVCVCVPQYQRRTRVVFLFSILCDEKQQKI